MYRLLRPAHLTLNLATPMEGAGTSLDDNGLLSLVTPTTAHQIAAVDSDAGVVAQSTVGP